MRNYIFESMNSWKQHDNNGDVILYVNKHGEVDVTGERVATSREIQNQYGYAQSFLNNNENISSENNKW